MKIKIFLSRVLLCLAGILCLNCDIPAHAQPPSKEKIAQLQKALKNFTAKTPAVSIEATFDQAQSMIQTLKPEETALDQDQNLRFKYAGRWFVHKDDGSGKESSYILCEDPKQKAVVFTVDSLKKN